MTATIGFVGDLMSHAGFVLLEAEGQSFASFVDPEVRALCRAQDEMWGNLEGPVTRESDGLSVALQFAARPPRSPRLFFLERYLPVFHDLGFTLLGIANNHSFDFGSVNDMRETGAVARRQGFAVTGEAFEPAVRVAGGLSFAVFATTCHVNGDHYPEGSLAFLNRNSFPRLSEAIARWKKQVDYIVVMTHWGRDYEPLPGNDIRGLAHRLLAAGADVVYGNHPHILWPIEQPSPRQLICYSLGNFFQLLGCVPHHPSAALYQKALTSGLLSLRFESGSVTPNFYPLEVRDNFREWLLAMKTTKSYWSWGFEDYAAWHESLAGNRCRLWSKVFRNGEPRPVPATPLQIQELYPEQLRSTMYEAPVEVEGHPC